MEHELSMPSRFEVNLKRFSIINDISSVIKKSFNYRHSDSSDNSFDDNFPFTVSASSSAIAGGASAAASASAGGG